MFFSHLQLQGSQVQLSPHLQPFSAPTPISDPSKCLHAFKKQESETLKPKQENFIFLVLIFLKRTLSAVPRQEQESQLWSSRQSSCQGTSCIYKIINKRNFYKQRKNDINGKNKLFLRDHLRENRFFFNSFETKNYNRKRKFSWPD